MLQQSRCNALGLQRSDELKIVSALNLFTIRLSHPEEWRSLLRMV
jgi:hypothetical protein